MYHLSTYGLKPAAAYSTETPSDTYYLSIIYDECAARKVLYYQTSAWPT